MLLTEEEYIIFHKTFDNISTFVRYHRQDNTVSVDKIKITKFNTPGKLLCTLLQQGILKEFLIEKVAYMHDQKYNIDQYSIDLDYDIRNSYYTFNWAHASIGDKTSISNWGAIILASQNRDRCDELSAPTNIVQKKE